MVFDGAGNAYLVWPIMFSRSMDNGRSWSHPQPYGDPRLGRYGNPDIAIDSAGVLYMVYEFVPNREALYQLWFMRSLDHGETWGTPRPITNTPRFTGWPKVEVDSNGRLRVVWHDICNLHNWNESPLPGCSGPDLYHLTSTDRGDTWTQQRIVSGSAPWTIHTAVDRAGAFYAFWSFSPGPGNPGGVYMYKTADGGATWTATFLGPGNEKAAAIDSDGTVHVLVVSGPPDNLVVNYRRGAHRGTVWSDSVVLTGIVGQSGYNPNWVTIGADPKNNVLMAYQSGVSGNFEIYFSRSPNGGKTWLKPETSPILWTTRLSPISSWTPAPSSTSCGMKWCRELSRCITAAGRCAAISVSSGIFSECPGRSNRHRAPGGSRKRAPKATPNWSGCG